MTTPNKTSSWRKSFVTWVRPCVQAISLHKNGVCDYLSLIEEPAASSESLLFRGKSKCLHIHILNLHTFQGQKSRRKKTSSWRNLSRISLHKQDVVQIPYIIHVLHRRTGMIRGPRIKTKMQPEKKHNKKIWRSRGDMAWILVMEQIRWVTQSRLLWYEAGREIEKKGCETGLSCR